MKDIVDRLTAAALPGTARNKLDTEAAQEIAHLREQVERLRDALHTAGGALHRINPHAINDDDECLLAVDARTVGLAAVESALHKP